MNIAELFEQDELAALRELGIDPASLVFTEQSRLPFLKNRQFVCHLRFSGGVYRFELPPKFPRRFKSQIALIETKLLTVNNTIARRLMLGAKKNAEFVERFNSELFFKHSFYKGKRLLPAELFDFYETHPYYLIINLSSDADKQPFIALYAMAFYACSPEDIYTIDGIFSMQPERHADNAKKTAGNAVFNLILRNEREEIDRILLQMSKTLLKIQPPRVILSDTGMLAKNYTLFMGLAEVGRVFANLAKTSDVSQAAFDLMNYAPLVKLCDLISVIGDDEDYRESAIYKKCSELF
jgi:hypothetical protein